MSNIEYATFCITQSTDILANILLETNGDTSLKEVKVKSVSEYVKHVEEISNQGLFWYRGVAKRTYLPIPKLIWKHAVRHEGSMEHQFLVSYKAYIKEHSLNLWEIFSLMQHHGLPTRLLDWSESALVALFFALSTETSSTAYRIVWALNPYKLNKETIGRGTLYCPAVIKDKDIQVGEEIINFDSYLPPNLRPSLSMTRHSSPIAIHSTQHLKRVSSQKGCFTVHGTDTDSVDTYLNDDSHFHMIKIDARTKKSRDEMLKVLGNMGIDEEFIFQDLDSLCDKIKRKLNL